MASERGPERLCTFLDAVVAIAITLLVLPLVDLLATDGGRTDLGRLVSEHGADSWAFLLGFAVIARLWWAHHRLGERVRSLDDASVLLDLGWVLTVVVLPFTTQVGVYTGTITVSSAFITVLDLVVARREPLRTPGVEGDARAALTASVVTTVLFAVALVLGTTIGAVNSHGLLLLLLSGPAERLVARRRPHAGARGRSGQSRCAPAGPTPGG